MLYIGYLILIGLTGWVLYIVFAPMKSLNTASEIDQPELYGMRSLTQNEKTPEHELNAALRDISRYTESREASIGRAILSKEITESDAHKEWVGKLHTNLMDRSLKQNNK